MVYAEIKCSRNFAKFWERFFEFLERDLLGESSVEESSEVLFYFDKKARPLGYIVLECVRDL